MNWTVPSRIFKVRAHLEGNVKWGVPPGQGSGHPEGGSKGGIIEVEFDVVPGEIFRLGALNPSSTSLLLAEDTPDPNDGSVGPIAQADIFAVVGLGGDAGNKSGDWGGNGGDGGGTSGDSGSSSGAGGGGGGASMSSGGGVGSGNSGCSNSSQCWNSPGQPNGGQASAGGALYGGDGGWVNCDPGDNQKTKSAGAGGSGWYGGGGGQSGYQNSSGKGGGGGGGTSKIQVPASRNPVTVKDEKGTATGVKPGGSGLFTTYINMVY